MTARTDPATAQWRSTVPLYIHLGFELDALDDGRSQVRLKFQPHLGNSRGEVHGGTVAALPARLPAPGDCLIWRREQRVYFRTLPADEAIAAAALRRGRSFGVICNALARAGDVDTAPTRAAQLLASWLAEGLLAA